MTKSWKLAAVVGIIALVLASAAMFGPGAAAPALARAGGGEHFRPGGGDSGGGFSGGSDHDWGGGDREGLMWLIYLIIYLPLPWPLKILIVIAILVAAGMGRKRARRGKAVMSRAASPPVFAPPAPPPPPAVSAPNLLAGLAELKARDPNFSEQGFEDVASTAFFKIQEAWNKKDLSIARAFASPALLQRFEVQLAGLRQAGRTNVMENLAVGSVEIVEVTQDGGLDYVTAKIQASAVDYTKDDKTGQIVSGDREVRPFTEYWSFLRSIKVQTQVSAEPESKNCPNCGAPLALNAAGRCDYCGSDVTSGQYDWVLAEISQASAWRPRTHAARPANISPLAAGRYVIGLVQCPNCGANVQDVLGVTQERCWRCGGTVPTAA